MTTCEKDFTLHIDPAASCYANPVSTAMTVTGYGLAVYGSTILTPDAGYTAGIFGRVSKVDTATNTYDGFSAIQAPPMLAPLVTDIFFCEGNDCIYAAVSDLNVSVDSRIIRRDGDTLAEVSQISSFVISLDIRSLSYVSSKAHAFGVANLGANAYLVDVNIGADTMAIPILSVGTLEATGICYRPSNDRLYATLDASPTTNNTVLIVNPTTHAVIGSMPGNFSDHRLFGIVHDPIHDKLYIAARRASTLAYCLLCVDPATGNFDAEVALAATSIFSKPTFDSVKNHILVPGGTSLYAVDTATNTLKCTWGPYGGAVVQAEVGGGKLCIAPSGSSFVTLS